MNTREDAPSQMACAATTASMRRSSPTRNRKGPHAGSSVRAHVLRSAFLTLATTCRWRLACPRCRRSHSFRSTGHDGETTCITLPFACVSEARSVSCLSTSATIPAAIPAASTRPSSIQAHATLHAAVCLSLPRYSHSCCLDAGRRYRALDSGWESEAVRPEDKSAITRSLALAATVGIPRFEPAGGLRTAPGRFSETRPCAGSRRPIAMSHRLRNGSASPQNTAEPITAASRTRHLLARGPSCRDTKAAALTLRPRQKLYLHPEPNCRQTTTQTRQKARPHGAASGPNSDQQ